MSGLSTFKTTGYPIALAWHAACSAVSAGFSSHTGTPKRARSCLASCSSIRRGTAPASTATHACAFNRDQCSRLSASSNHGRYATMAFTARAASVNTGMPAAKTISRSRLARINGDEQTPRCPRSIDQFIGDPVEQITGAIDQHGINVDALRQHIKDGRDTLTVVEIAGQIDRIGHHRQFRRRFAQATLQESGKTGTSSPPVISRSVSNPPMAPEMDATAMRRPQNPP